VRTDPFPEIIERRERLTRRQNSPDEQQEAEAAFAIFAPADIHWLVAEVQRLRTIVGEPTPSPNAAGVGQQTLGPAV
jgi:hypothetical protein